MNHFSNTTSDALVSPVTPQDLADFMSMEYNVADDALLNGFIFTACEMCISYANNEMLSRSYTLKYDRYPSEGQALGGVSPMSATAKAWITIPVSPVSAITSITIDDVAYTDFTEDLQSKPARIIFDTMPPTGNIAINYTAGVATAAEVDPRLILGIKLLATYLYENRGCEVTSAMTSSGARMAIESVKTIQGGL